MYLDNGKISGRQALRVGILENIALGIIFIPYLVTGLAGKYHALALVLGLILFTCYSLIIYFYSVSFPMGFIDTLHTSMGGFGRVLEGIYALRYMIKAAVISVFFALIVQEYMLRSFNLWAILISFILISGYGASRDIEKRGRLLEFLFWWMIIPLIFVAVLSVTNIKWDAFSWPVLNAGAFKQENILEGSYAILIPLSSVELLMMTLHREKKRSWKNDINILLWIIITMVLAYVFVVGILGAGWAGSGQGSALNVMQSSSVSSSTVRRLDYPVFAFWIIGVFATVSGYIFYAKEFTGSMFRLEKEKSYGRALIIITLLVLIFVALFNVGWWRSFVVTYIIWADIAISLLVPGILLVISKYGPKRALKTLTLFIVLSFSLTGCKGEEIAYGLVKGVETADAKESKAPSIEGRAYVTELEIEGGNVLDMATYTDAGYEKTYRFKFKTADLSEYKGDAGAKLKTNDYDCEAISLEAAVDTYNKDNKSMPDMGHMKKITLSGRWQDYKDILLETVDMPNVSKSTKVKLEGEDEYALMDIISILYGEEDAK